jgi:hypothetical protein
MPPASPDRQIRATWYAGSETLLGEFWTMLHLPYTGMVLGFVLLGAAVAPSFSWTLLDGTLLAYFLGLGIGAHFLDQIPGMGSRYVTRWPTWALWVVGFVTLIVAVTLGIVGSLLFVGPLMLPLVGAQALCAIGYPLASWFRGAFHRDSVFALSWGSLPFLISFYAQTHTMSVGSLLLAAIFGGIALLEIHLSRISRRLRLQTRSRRDSTDTRSDQGFPSFRGVDLALEILSFGTIFLSLSVFAIRVGFMA